MNHPPDSGAIRPPGPLWRGALAVLARLPQGALSRVAGALADVPLARPLRRPVLRLFAALTGIDASEAEQPLEDYPSVNAFFVRRLRPGARSFSGDPRSVVSPVDGILGECGTVTAGRLIQAKGRDYPAAALIGDDATRFEGGSFLTIYLAPRHYHRIHTPLPGSVVRTRHMPGRLFPVNAPAVALVPDLFTVNERLVVTLATALGEVAVVAVGAFNVGRISAAFDLAWSGRDATWITNRGTPPPAVRSYDPPLALEAGAELMAFHLGSTVVILLEPGVQPEPGLVPGREVRAGTLLARGA